MPGIRNRQSNIRCSTMMPACNPTARSKGPFCSGPGRSAPRLLFPCPLPKRLLQQLNTNVKEVLRALPFVCRSLQYDLQVEASSLSWQKTPFADALLSPSFLPIDKVGPCRCQELPLSVPRYKGHAITRFWAALPFCTDLARFGDVSFQCRTFASLDHVCTEFGKLVKRFLQTAGFADEHLEEALQSIVASAKRLLGPWLSTLPPYMIQDYLLRARRRLWSHGMVASRVDRNPGRLVVLCRELWLELQHITFLRNERYALLSWRPSNDDPDYANVIRDSFLTDVVGSVEWAGRKPSGSQSRPRSYWTVKQKSLIHSLAEPIVKLRPLVTHSVHPLRIALSRLARAFSLLVSDARLLVMARRPSHLPMWQLHSGSREWLQRISATTGWWGCDEYDVCDCFLNTLRHKVLCAARFWIDITGHHTRRQPCFAIAKDGKKGDHRVDLLPYIIGLLLASSCCWPSNGTYPIMTPSKCKKATVPLLLCSSKRVYRLVDIFQLPTSNLWHCGANMNAVGPQC